MSRQQLTSASGPVPMPTTGRRGLVLRESEDLHSADTEALKYDLRKRQAGDKVKMRV